MSKSFTDRIKPVANTPTTIQYTNLQLAYAYFNDKLFDGQLSDCLLVFGRDQKNCYGYFHAEQWKAAEGKQKCHMISLTPMHLSRGIEATFATLVHEMCHLQQQDFGEPSKNGYHNSEWADMMEAVGLMPTDNGQEDGKRTGPKVTHYILKDGPFAKALAKMPDHIRLPWIGAGDLTKKNKPNRNKVTYQCPCENKVWGKPDLQIRCEDCGEMFEPC